MTDYQSQFDEALKEIYRLQDMSPSGPHDPEAFIKLKGKQAEFKEMFQADDLAGAWLEAADVAYYALKAARYSANTMSGIDLISSLADCHLATQGVATALGRDMLDVYTACVVKYTTRFIDNDFRKDDKVERRILTKRLSLNEVEHA